ncbi:MAG: hypothetical protein JNL69_05005 [Bacteroidia bacterium]|nr:hypothetical protein [Bacteroidia bacterium]
MVDAILYLKTGQKKVGVLISEGLEIDFPVQFISNNNLNSNKKDCIEFLEQNLIEAIDISPK